MGSLYVLVAAGDMRPTRHEEISFVQKSLTILDYGSRRMTDDPVDGDDPGLVDPL